MIDDVAIRASLQVAVDLRWPPTNAEKFDSVRFAAALGRKFHALNPQTPGYEVFIRLKDRR